MLIILTLECDKNYGLALVPLDILIQADCNTMKQMDAVEINNTEDWCMATVADEIGLFERNLSMYEKQIMDDVGPDRSMSTTCAKFPSLKNTLKVGVLCCDRNLF